jgi:hypothetical protein
MSKEFKKLKIKDKKQVDDNKLENDSIKFKFGIIKNSDKQKEEDTKKKAGMKDALQVHYKK